MQGRERVAAALSREETDRLAVMPILHSGLPALLGVPLGAYFSSARAMANTIVRGYRSFGYDGVQLSLGVTGESEALGADVVQPDDGSPVLKRHPLEGVEDDEGLARLRSRVAQRPAKQGGRMPLYYEAVSRTAKAIGDEAFVLAMLRGPLLAASQLCGVESLLVGLLTAPAAVRRLLDFTTEVALTLGRWLLGSGAHGLVLGEATCSPNFISPRHYRALVKEHHTALIAGLRTAGWQHVGLHVCGNTVPILEDLIDTGAAFLDVDYQVPAATALQLAGGRVALRGNLDPSSVFRFGSPDHVARETRCLTASLRGQDGGYTQGWVLSSGCDIPPGTPRSNIAAFVRASTATSA